MTSSTQFNIFNALFFQLGWFACVLYGSLWGGAFTAVTLIVHFRFSKCRFDDFLALLVAVGIGIVHDTILMRSGQIQFDDVQSISPLWVLCVWALLGINFNHSLIWVYQRFWIGALLGAVFGPLSYIAGAKLSTAEWTAPMLQVVPTLAIMWFLVLPIHRFICRILSQRFAAYAAIQHPLKRS